jgi:hypothetical protein
MKTSLLILLLLVGGQREHSRGCPLDLGMFFAFSILMVFLVIPSFSLFYFDHARLTETLYNTPAAVSAIN